VVAVLEVLIKTCTVSPCKVGNYEDAEVNKKVMIKVIEDK
tara:strand:- start:515 stop:634 length:120 start_codon:yes stop_codon:yes gene_type:complete